MIEYQALKRRRTEQERQRRKQFGDAGAKFGAKEICFGYDGISNTITCAIAKDDLIIEIEYLDNQ